MKTIKLALSAFFSVILSAGFAQKITVLEGDLKVLKGETILNVQYDWEDIAVGKFSKEEDYISRKVAEYNEKESGRGNKWREAWNGDKIGRFQPEFEKLFNKYSSKLNLYLGNEKTAKYTAIVKTTFIEPGFNVYVTKKPASVDLTITIVETDNPEKVVVKLVSKSNPGRTYGMNDYDTGLRISESYALAGKKLAAFFVKQIGK